MKILAISGKATAGKTTLAKMIKGAYTDVHICPFAEELKLKTSLDFGIPMEDVLNNKNKIIIIGGKEMTVRQLLIKVGAMYREIDPLFWVNKALDKMAEIDAKTAGKPYSDNIFIIDDLRFRNEATRLRDMGATIVRIERPGIQLIDDQSEKDLDDYAFDITISNDRDMEHLERRLVDVVPRDWLARRKIGK